MGMLSPMPVPFPRDATAVVAGSERVTLLPHRPEPAEELDHIAIRNKVRECHTSPWSLRIFSRTPTAT